MVLQEYNNLLREHLDFSDTQTTKFIKYINESDQQSQLLAALAGALYEKIVEKSDKIDFGSIPRSRGDITKVDGYNNTVECINILRKLVVEYKEDPAIVDIELTALENIKALRPVFMKGFANNASFAMMYYNVAVASIQHSVSFLISVAIQFVKDPNTKNITKALDKAAYRDAESNLLLESLAQMNKAYASGQLEKVLREAVVGIKESVESDEFSEDTIATTDDVTDAIEDAPASEDTPIADEEISEDVIFKIAAGDFEDETEVEDEDEENEKEEVSPFADSNESEEDSDELAAGANNPNTQPDDEVEPTPTMPINGACSANVRDTIEEKQGNSIVNRHYHKHPTANAGYGDGSVNEAINLKNVKLKDIANGVVGAYNGEKGGVAGVAKYIFNKTPGANWIKFTVLGVSLLIFTIKVVIPAIRNAIAFLWTLKADLAETLAIQANLIELNAIELEANEDSNLSEEKKAKVVERQLKIAQKLRALADKFAIKDKKANTEAKKEVEKEKKKTASDLKDQLPDDVLVDSDLF